MSSPFSKIPQELWNEIIPQSLPPPTLINTSTHPSTSIDIHSPYRQLVRYKKGLTLVCRAWYPSAVRVLYEDICIFRACQVDMLFLSLNLNLGSDLDVDLNLDLDLKSTHDTPMPIAINSDLDQRCRYIKRIRISTLPPSSSNSTRYHSFHNHLQHLINVCPNLVFLHLGMCSLSPIPLRFKSELSNPDPNPNSNSKPKLLIPTQPKPRPFSLNLHLTPHPHLTHLTLTDQLHAPTLHALLSSTSHLLTSLDIYDFFSPHALSFPRLIDLTLRTISNDYNTDDFLISRMYRFPRVERVSFEVVSAKELRIFRRILGFVCGMGGDVDSHTNTTPNINTNTTPNTTPNTNTNINTTPNTPTHNHTIRTLQILQPHDQSYSHRLSLKKSTVSRIQRRHKNALQAILDALPSLQHLILHPAARKGLRHAGVRWVDVWEPTSVMGEDVGEVDYFWEMYAEIGKEGMEGMWPCVEGVRLIGQVMQGWQIFGGGSIPLIFPPSLTFDPAFQPCNIKYPGLGVDIRVERDRIYCPRVLELVEDEDEDEDEDYEPSESELGSSEGESFDDSEGDGDGDGCIDGDDAMEDDDDNDGEEDGEEEEEGLDDAWDYAWDYDDDVDEAGYEVEGERYNGNIDYFENVTDDGLWVLRSAR